MKILVTGGAGFIGSHIVDQLIGMNIEVVVIDVLEKPTHTGIPKYINPKAKYYYNSITEKDKLIEALNGVSTIIHLAATGGFTDNISKYAHENSYATALMLEVIKEKKLPVTKILVASSVAVYGEGKYLTGDNTVIYPRARNIEDLDKGRWEVHYDGKACKPLPIDEAAPVAPGNYYALSKYDQENIVKFFAEKEGISFVALRFFLCYGPRQSLTNPYTGICSIFTNQAVKRQPLIIYEDGNQTRDFIYVADLVDACILCLFSKDAENRILNAGTGIPTKINDIAKTICTALETDFKTQKDVCYRVSDARHVVADVTKIKALGFKAGTGFNEGFAHYLEWAKKESSLQNLLSS